MSVIPSTTAIRSAEVLVQPGPQLRHARITTEDGVVGPRGRDAQRPRAVGRVLPARPRGAAAHRQGRAPHRGHLAVPLPRRYWRRGPVTMAAIAAVDMALWDIKAKARRDAAVPAARRRAARGASRTATRAARDLRRAVDSVRAHLDRGSAPSACRSPSRAWARCTASRAAAVGGPLRLRARQARRPRRSRRGWDTRALPAAPAEGLRGGPGRVRTRAAAAPRRAPPADPDPGGRASASDLEPYDLFWLEDCTPAENQEALRLVRQHTTTPLAIGEVFNTVWDYQTLVQRAAHRLRPLRGHARGRHHRAATHLRLRRPVPDQVRHATARPTSRPSAWRPRCTWTSRSTTSASRSTWSTARSPPRCSGTRSRSPTGCCTPASAGARRRATTTTRPRGTPTRPAYLPVAGSPTARCTTGDRTPRRRTHDPGAPDVAARNDASARPLVAVVGDGVLVESVRRDAASLGLRIVDADADMAILPQEEAAAPGRRPCRRPRLGAGGFVLARTPGRILALYGGAHGAVYAWSSCCAMRRRRRRQRAIALALATRARVTTCGCSTTGTTSTSTR